MRLKLLVLFFLLGCNDDMQFTQQGIISSKVPSGNAYTTADGKQVVWVVGDSFTVRRSVGGYGAAPDAGTVYQYDQVTTNDLVEVGATDIIQPPGNAVPDTNYGSMWPNWGRVFYERTGFKPVLVVSGVGGSNYAPRTGETDNWSTASTLYDDSKADLDACLSLLGLEYPKYIVVICGINDARGATALATVQTEINDFYTKLTTDYPDTEILIYQIGRDEIAVNSARVPTVRKYLREVVRDYANCHFVGTFAHWWQAGLYAGDDLHLSLTGLNEAGEMFGRWLDNPTYDKIARPIIASHFGTLSSTRKNLIASWVTSLGADYYDLEYFYNFKTPDEDDTYMDYSFLWGGFKTSSTFTANSQITTNGTSSYWRTGFQADRAAVITQNDGFAGIKVKDNRSSTAALRVAMGGGDATKAIHIGQLSGGNVYYRFNDVTNSAYATDTTIIDDSFYVAGRDSGNKYLYKNGSQVATAAVASAGVNDDALYVGCNNSAGTAGAFMDADFEYSAGGKFTTVDQSNLYTASEALIDGW